jgi:thiol:disulfide interchange protein DsbD
LLSSPAHVVSTEQVRAELQLHAPQGIQAGKTFWLGLQIEHQPQWHTYWQNPGDSGLPTQLQWQLPAGLQAGTIAWPLPKKFPIGSLANYGYEGRVLLAVPVTVAADFRFPDSGPLTLQLQADWLVCRQECIPQEGRCVLRIASQSSQSVHGPLFEALLRQQPQVLPLGASNAQVHPDRLALTVAGLPRALWRPFA